MRIIFENKQRLNEDKVVKFGGQTFPKFGWAVILMGGGGSGKSTVFNSLVPIEGKYINVDDLKENPRFWDIHETVWDDEEGKWVPTGDTRNDLVRDSILENPNIDIPYEKVRYKDKGYYFGQDRKNEEPRRENVYKAELSNSNVANAVHASLRPLGKKVKQSGYDVYKSAADKRLPNVIFDIVADEMKDITTVVDNLKPAGYKIAIVWVSSTINRALKNNSKRDRVVDPSVILGAHGRVLNTLNTLFDSGYIKNIDEFWVVNTAVAQKYFNDKTAYHDLQNVFEIPTVPDGLKLFMQKYSGNSNWNQSWSGNNSKTYSRGRALNVRGRMGRQAKEIADRELNSL